MAILTIGGTAMPSPAKLSVQVLDVDGNATRNAQGTLIRDRIAVKRKLQCTFPALTWSQASTLLTAISATSFSVTYPDPQTGAMATKTMYVGDRTNPVLKLTSGVYYWDQIQFDLIEL